MATPSTTAILLRNVTTVACSFTPPANYAEPPSSNYEWTKFLIAITATIMAVAATVTVVYGTIKLYWKWLDRRAELAATSASADVEMGDPILPRSGQLGSPDHGGRVDLSQVMNAQSRNEGTGTGVLPAAASLRGDEGRNSITQLGHVPLDHNNVDDIEDIDVTEADEPEPTHANATSMP